MDGSDRTEENINHQYRQIEQRLNDFQQAITKLFDNFFKTGVKIICILVGSTPHKIDHYSPNMCVFSCMTKIKPKI